MTYIHIRTVYYRNLLAYISTAQLAEKRGVWNGEWRRERELNSTLSLELPFRQLICIPCANITHCCTVMFTITRLVHDLVYINPFTTRIGVSSAPHQAGIISPRTRQDAVAFDIHHSAFI